MEPFKTKMVCLSQHLLTVMLSYTVLSCYVIAFVISIMNVTVHHNMDHRLQIMDMKTVRCK